MKKIILAALAAFLLVGCRSSHEIAIVAHRGYWNCEQGGQSHNSIASLQAAQDIKVWGSEFDVTMTADGEMVVFHDWSADGKALCLSNWSDLEGYRLPNGERMPTLDEYLTQFEKSGTSMVLELKAHSTPEQERAAVEKSLELIKQHGLYDPSRVTFISFSMEACAAYAGLAPGFDVQYLDSDVTPAQCKERGLTGIDYHQGCLLDEHPEYVEQAHALGMTVNCWTIDDPDAMKRLIELGVDQITTNCPEVTREVLKEMKIKELKTK